MDLMREHFVQKNGTSHKDLYRSHIYYYYYLSWFLYFRVLGSYFFFLT